MEQEIFLLGLDRSRPLLPSLEQLQGDILPRQLFLEHHHR
jgi:hypothetical protein